MKSWSFFALAVPSVLAVACAAPLDPQQTSVEAAPAALTLEECATQRDACFRKNTILGLLTCPAQYAQCTATAQNGVPAQVASAISDAAECRKTARSCAADANNPAQVALCAEDEAQCIASIVDVQLPNVAKDATKCVDDTIGCINSSETASDLRECGAGLRDCALKTAESALPEPVAKVVGDVAKCNSTLEACIRSAENATGLAQCNEAQAACVAKTLNVTLPEVPVSKVVHCTEQAANCALDASSINDVTACANTLNRCAADVVGSIQVPEALSCEQKWTVCMTKNPLNFLECATQLAGCRD